MPPTLSTCIFDERRCNLPRDTEILLPRKWRFNNSSRTSKKDGSASSQPCGGLDFAAKSAMAVALTNANRTLSQANGKHSRRGGAAMLFALPTFHNTEPPRLWLCVAQAIGNDDDASPKREKNRGDLFPGEFSSRRGWRWAGGWEQRRQAKTDSLKTGSGRMPEAFVPARRCRRLPSHAKAGNGSPRSIFMSKESDVGRNPSTSLASTVARRRPQDGSAIAVGLFFVSLLSHAGALLQLDRVPNRITNERSATFTYVCTPIDVADGDSCDVKVGECS